jgi:hypothetical protein
MATLYTDVATVQNAPHVGDSFNTPQRAAGKLRIVTAVITLASAQIADVINICKLRKGDEIVAGYMTNAALGASTTLNLGDTDAGGSATRYLDATGTSSAARTEFPASNKTANVPYTITDNCWLQSVLAGGVASGKVIFTVFIARAGA